MNCKYMNMLRVVRGNAFKLKIAVEAYTPSGRRIDSFALGEAMLKLDKNGTLTTKEYTILEGTTILVAFDGSESLGVYGFQMSGEYEGEAWRWANAEIFQIVETNAKANIPDGCVLLNDTYNMAMKIVLSGGDGVTFTPSVSEQGIISWTNDGGLPNPEPRNIRGPRGEQGPQGEVGPQGPRGQMGLRGQIGPKGDKGDKGDTGATPVLDVTASVDENVGNPMVVVESFGPAEHRTFDFQFKNLKGQKGETGATGPQGPQGQQGEPGNYTKPASGIPLNDLNGNVASGIVYDVTANNSGATFASLSALLSSGSLSTLIPTSVRKGGMQIRFVCSSDNNYVQFRYMPSDASTVATFTNVDNWQGVDESISASSENLIESGGVFAEINSFSQNITSPKIIIKKVIVGKTLYYKFKNNNRKVACIGFFDASDTLIGSYIGNMSSGGGAGIHEGEIVVPTNAICLKAVCNEAFDIVLYYTDSLYGGVEDVKKDLQEFETNLYSEVYNYDETYVDIFNPTGTSKIPANQLCFTYDGYQVKDKLPAVVLYAPSAAGENISGTINLVSINESVGALILTEAFNVSVDETGYATIFFKAPYISSYNNTNVCVQFDRSVVLMAGSQTNSGFKYYNPTDNSVTSYSTYIGYFTLAEVNPFATKKYVEDYVSNIASSVSVCTPEDNLQDFITNNRIVNLIAGTYNISTSLTIPSNTKIVGVRGGTILKLNGATTAISFDGDEENVQIENLTFEGSNTITRSSKTISQLRLRDGIGTEVGIYITGHTSNVVVTNCEFRDFSLSGMHLYMTLVSSGQQCNNVKVTDCIFTDSWAGVLLDKRAEFHTFVNCSFNNCVVGAYVCGGNNVFGSSRFDLNGTGIVIFGNSGWNDSHGHASNCSFDHSLGYGIACTGVNYGYTFTNCHVFDGIGFIISDSIGIAFVGGMIACKIVMDSVRGAGFNLIHDVMFGSTASYDTGTIEGDTTRLSLKNNRFLAQDDYTAINNNN